MFVFFSGSDLEKWSRLHGVELHGSGRQEEQELSHNPVLAAHGCMSDVSFFKSLGVENVASIDVSPWEGADFTHNMNEPIPESLHGQYEAVFDGGTTQSIFHLPQLLCNVIDLLKPGGRVIHALAPSHNHVDHGFFMFSPTFFHDYYSANGWTVDRVLLCEQTPFWTAGRLCTGSFHVYEYEPGCLDHLSFGRYGSAQLNLFVVATKTEGATCEVIPQQGYYQDFWQKDAETRTRELMEQAQRVKPRRRLYASKIYRSYKHFGEWLRRKAFARKMPRRIASY